MHNALRWLCLLACVIPAAGGVHAQQSLPDPVAPVPSSANAPPPDGAHSGLYRDLDLLRRSGFAEAQQASIALRVFDRSGTVPLNLTASDFTLIVNGTARVPRVHAPGSSQSTVLPMVLLVLPPNEPVVHSIAIRNAEKYFGAQSAELLAWNVGIFDANGKMTPFTDGRTQLLANLDVIDHTVEPFQYASNVGLPSQFRWDGSWLLKAEDAIAMMQHFEGPKVILAINPLGEQSYGLNDQMFAHDGPESLTRIAQTIGAHIYIARVGGPEVYIPGGGAADDHPAQVNTPGGPLLGTKPSYHQQVDPQMIAALNYYAYRASMVMQTAQNTLGGYANTLSELAAKIHRDLDENYSLDFDLTPEDTDKGTPSVEVRMVRHELRVAILDVIPIGSSAAVNREVVSKQLMDRVRKATQKPVASTDFRIAQHADYFPLHGGLEPLLPMSGSVEWTGRGKAPSELFVIESVDDPNLSVPILERAVQARWNGRSLSWERDGVLRPGNYVWRVAVHDGEGKVFASSEEKVGVGFPRDVKIAFSSLVVGRGCREGASSVSGLQRRPVKDADTQTHLLIDPMDAEGCRVRPEADARFGIGDTLYALVRIYPSAKLDKQKPESWVAKFQLRAENSNLVELEREVHFTADAGSGYVALVEVPLRGKTISLGPHVLDAQLQGPGMHGNQKVSRSVSISVDGPR